MWINCFYFNYGRMTYFFDLALYIFISLANLFPFLKISSSFCTTTFLELWMDSWVIKLICSRALFNPTAKFLSYNYFLYDFPFSFSLWLVDPKDLNPSRRGYLDWYFSSLWRCCFCLSMYDDWETHGLKKVANFLHGCKSLPFLVGSDSYNWGIPIAMQFG